MVEILVADDHEVMRQGMKGLLEMEQEWHVCAQASDGREAVALAARVSPNVAVLDLSMPELNGLEATRQIMKVSPSTKVLIFTVHDSEHLAREVLESGAHGYVLKTDAATQLASAVKAVEAGSHYVSPRLSHARVDSSRTGSGSRAQRSTLTGREREITQLLAEGKSNWCAATILGISVKTVETHRAKIMHKLGLESIVELVHYAVRNQIVAP